MASQALFSSPLNRSRLKQILHLPIHLNVCNLYCWAADNGTVEFSEHHVLHGMQWLIKFLVATCLGFFLPVSAACNFCWLFTAWPHVTTVRSFPISGKYSCTDMAATAPVWDNRTKKKLLIVTQVFYGVDYGWLSWSQRIERMSNPFTSLPWHFGGRGFSR